MKKMNFFGLTPEKRKFSGVCLQHEIKKFIYMQGNFVMLQMDDLKQIVTEIVEEICVKRGFNEQSTIEENEWLTREEVCDMLHITYTTLWRKENEGIITKYKIGRRNLYSRKEVDAIFCSAVESTNNK